MFIKPLKIFLNKILSLSGYKISNLKYIYDSELNLVKSLNFFRIQSIIDVCANIRQFILRLFKKGFSGHVISFEPTTEAYNKLLLNAENMRHYFSWKIAERCGLRSDNFF